jgi:hypothetical protein
VSQNCGTPSVHLGAAIATQFLSKIYNCDNDKESPKNKTDFKLAGRFGIELVDVSADSEKIVD